eukprot:s918_g7.t1
MPLNMPASPPSTYSSPTISCSEFTLPVTAWQLVDFHFVWQAWHLRHWAGSGDGLRRRWSRVVPRLFCVAGVALGDICFRFVWQAWHLATWTFTLCGRRGT